MTETVEILPVETFEQAVDRLLRDLPNRTVGEFVRTDDVVDMLLDLQQISKN